MGYQSIVYGRIVSGADVALNKKIISEISTEQLYPWIFKEMFLVQELEQKNYYQDIIITFGATYKSIETSLTEWLIKFESVLSKLDFKTAKIEIETEITGTFAIFWQNKKYAYGSDDEYTERKLYSNDKWYYGYGYRNMWGILEGEDTGNALKEMWLVRHPFEINNRESDMLAELIAKYKTAASVPLEDISYILRPSLEKMIAENRMQLKNGANLETHILFR